MEIINILPFLLLAFIAGSWSWAMRGTVIGGEKGAMIPGLLFGLCIPLFLRNGWENFYLQFAAIGAFSMFHGGSATYGETLSFVLHSRDEGIFKGKYKKGMLGVFVNGAIWFGITGYFIALYFGYLNNIYSKAETIAIIALLPVIQYIGQLIFNRPYSKTEDVKPKIYFSVTRREEWGGYLLYLVLGLIYSLVKTDWLTALAVAAGILSGGLGFALGLFLYDFNNQHPEANLIAKLQKKHITGGWKLMEHTFGAVAFMLLTLFFIVSGSFLIPEAPAAASVSFLTVNRAFILIFIGIYLVQVVLTAVYQKVSGKEFSGYIGDLIMRPLFAVLPMLIIFFADMKTAQIACVAYCLFALLEKCIDGYFSKYKEKIPLYIVTLVITVLLTILSIKADAVTASQLVLITVIPYQAVALYRSFRLTPKEQKKCEESGIKGIEKYRSVIFGQVLEIIEIAIIYIGVSIVEI